MKEMLYICSYCEDKDKIEDILEKKHWPEVHSRISHSVCDSCFKAQIEIIDKMHEVLNSKK